MRVETMEMECARAEPEQQRAVRGMPALLVVTFLAFINYAALLPVVPLWAARGGATDLAVGATTGGMMAATVGTQLIMPRLLRTVRLKHLMLIGLLLLGGPSPFYLIWTEFAPIMALTVARGVGFAFVVTTGATLVAGLAGRGRLASSTSWYGVAAALPNLAALAGGVWAVEALGYGPVFWTTGVSCAAAMVLARSLPDHRGAAPKRGLTAVGRRTLLLLILFILTAMAFGAVTTFLPQSGPPASIAAIALLAASVALVAGRLAAGRIGDRWGSGRWLYLSVGLSSVGLAQVALSLSASAASMIFGAALLGAGFGASQNVSFVATVESLGPERSGPASAIWNACYDGGLGAGAFSLGWVIGHIGYSPAFVIMAVSMAVATLIFFLSSLPYRRFRTET